LNTKISYTYKDGSGYSYLEEVVVEGEVTFDDLEPFLSNDPGEPGFCPDDVGLPHPGRESGEGWPNDDDHCWVTLEASDVEPATKIDRVTHGKAKDLLAKFKKAHAKNWPAQTSLPE
jgi:hypothetical protein